MWVQKKEKKENYISQVCSFTKKDGVLSQNKAKDFKYFTLNERI